MNLKQLGPYSIGKQLGRGGMGTVFEGVNDDTGERVAVKVLSQSLAADEGFRERFEQEIETLRKLRHENIVRLHGFGEQDGTLFYTMELVDGTSLEQEIRLGRRFDWNEASQLGIQMCRGLKHAHDRGVIHRDIKPANLMITPDGQIKISDFGIAKLFGASGMTMAGGVIGTAEFMAPEQADGRPVSQRSDLYSVGGVLYAIIVGRPPFVSKSIVDVLQMQRFSKPDPLRRHNADVPREFDDIVMQLLAKDPQERVSNAAVLMRRLESTERGLTRHVESKGDEGEFELGSGAATPVSPQADPGATSQVDLTRVASDETNEGESVDLMGPTRHSAGFDLAATQASVVDGAAESAEIEPATHYTPVAEQELGDDLLTSEGPSRNWPQIVLLAASLVVVIGLIIWFMQPASAADLLATIDADQDNGHTNVESPLNEFLERFPNHDRYGEMLELQEGMQEHAGVRNLRAKLRRKDASQLRSFERIFLNATESHLSPTQRVEELQALIALLANADSSEGKSLKECLSVAEHELEALAKEAEKYRQDEKQFVDASLATAQQLLASDVAEEQAEGRRILRSLIKLYSDESWAQDELQAAQAQLAELREQEADNE